MNLGGTGHVCIDSSLAFSSSFVVSARPMIRTCFLLYKFYRKDFVCQYVKITGSIYKSPAEISRFKESPHAKWVASSIP